MIAIVYFVLWRPQQRRAKEQREMVQAARRGDVVVTTGGLIGKISKAVDDNEVELEIAPNVQGASRPLRHRRGARQGRAGQGRAEVLGQGRAERLSASALIAAIEIESPMLRFAPWKLASVLALVAAAILLVVAELPVDRSGRRARRPGSELHSAAPDRARPRPSGRRLHADAGRRRLGRQGPGRGAARRRAPEDARRQDRALAAASRPSRAASWCASPTRPSATRPTASCRR